MVKSCNNSDAVNDERKIAAEHKWKTQDNFTNDNTISPTGDRNRHSKFHFRYVYTAVKSANKSETVRDGRTCLWDHHRLILFLSARWRLCNRKSYLIFVNNLRIFGDRRKMLHAVTASRAKRARYVSSVTVCGSSLRTNGLNHL
jgi:hypothetical protein